MIVTTKTEMIVKLSTTGQLGPELLAIGVEGSLWYAYCQTGRYRFHKALFRKILALFQPLNLVFQWNFLHASVIEWGQKYTLVWDRQISLHQQVKEILIDLNNKKNDKFISWTGILYCTQEILQFFNRSLLTTRGNTVGPPSGCYLTARCLFIRQGCSRIGW